MSALVAVDGAGLIIFVIGCGGQIATIASAPTRVFAFMQGMAFFGLGVCSLTNTFVFNSPRSKLSRDTNDSGSSLSITSSFCLFCLAGEKQKLEMQVATTSSDDVTSV